MSSTCYYFRDVIKYLEDPSSKKLNLLMHSRDTLRKATRADITNLILHSIDIGRFKELLICFEKLDLLELLIRDMKRICNNNKDTSNYRDGLLYAMFCAVGDLSKKYPKDTALQIAFLCKFKAYQYSGYPDIMNEFKTQVLCEALSKRVLVDLVAYYRFSDELLLDIELYLKLLYLSLPKMTDKKAVHSFITQGRVYTKDSATYLNKIEKILKGSEFLFTYKTNRGEDAGYYARYMLQQITDELRLHTVDTTLIPKSIRSYIERKVKSTDDVDFVINKIVEFGALDRYFIDDTINKVVKV